VVSAQNVPPEDTLVLTNGRIHTMDAANTIATSVAIRNGRFVAINAAPAAGPGVRTINLGGRTVVPGLVEPHIHIVSLANRPGYHTILENTTSIREVQEALAARRKDAPQGAWITSMGGWHPNQWTEHRHPTLAELDQAVPDRPVLLYERFTGPCATNSMGKAFFDAVDAAPPVHPDIKKINVSPTGAIAGAGQAGNPSASALFLLRRIQTFADRKRSTIDAMNYAASVGLTTHLDQVLFPTPGPLHPSQILSNLDQYKMYDPWLELHH
jgi:predicted amidohydrolase YtcJ